MKVEFTNVFHKQLSDIRDQKLLEEVGLCIQNVISSKSIKDIHNLKKLKGYKSAYRIKTGNYRIGFVLREDIAIFSAVLNRKDIYRKFP